MSAEPANGRAGFRPTISRSLQWLTLLLLVLIVSVTIERVLIARNQLLGSTAEQLSRLGTVFAEQTDRAVATAVQMLRGTDDVLEEMRAQGRVDAAQFDAVLRGQLGAVPQVSQIAIADARGRVLYTSNPASPDAAPSRLPGPGLALLAGPAGPGLAISDPFRDTNGQWTALLMRPIRLADGRAGHAVAFLNLPYFQDFFRAIRLNDSGSIQLHRRDGKLLVRYPPNDRLIGMRDMGEPPFAGILAQAGAGTAILDSPLDGQPRLVAVQALRQFPLAVSVSMREASVLAPWRQQTWTLSITALVASLVIAALLLMIARESRRAERLLVEYIAAKVAAETSAGALQAQIDERERAEGALRQAQRIEAVGQLTGGVAHDFNNLLTVLLGNIDLLQHSLALDPVSGDRLLRMRRAAERGAALTDQLLAFARRQPLAPRAIALNDVVRGMTGLLQSAIGSNIAIETRFADDPWPALVDPTQLELVILNLAINARDAMPQGGTLRVVTANCRLGPPAHEEEPPAGEYVVVRVSDTGEGMSAEVRAKAFEPFFTTKEPGRGSGLGLSQVFGLARQSGGGVQIESTPGKGTTVSVLLPRAAGEAAELAAAPHAEPAGTANRRILLVDDDEAVRQTTSMVLQSMGHHVMEAASGEQALALLAANPGIDMLLTDVAMPGMSGPTLARHARSQRPNLPIVLFSGYADPHAVADNPLPQRIIRKPFRAGDLASQIETALREFQPAGGGEALTHS
ncbi:MAG: response regulator [Rhodospirillales bacterium]|nr:response regulator [Rhodospirillales bacterium]